MIDVMIGVIINATINPAVMKLLPPPLGPKIDLRTGMLLTWSWIQL